MEQSPQQSEGSGQKSRLKSASAWWKRRSKTAKIVIVVVTLAIIGAIAGAGGAGGKGEASKADASNAVTTTTAITVPAYEVIEVEDIPFASAKRYSYRVVVAGDPTEADIRAISEEIIADAKESRPFNALSIFFYRSAGEIHGAYTVAMVEYAPGGVWGDAVNVDTGDYETMKMVVEMRTFTEAESTITTGQATGSISLKLGIFDLTETQRPGDRVEVWTNGLGSWYPSLEFGGDNTTIGPYAVGDQPELLIYPDGRDSGAEIKIMLSITDDLISLSDRDLVLIEIYDNKVLVMGTSIADLEQTFPR